MTEKVNEAFQLPFNLAGPVSLSQRSSATLSHTVPRNQRLSLGWGSLCPLLAPSHCRAQQRTTIKPSVYSKPLWLQSDIYEVRGGGCLERLSNLHGFFLSVCLSFLLCTKKAKSPLCPIVSLAA